MTGMDRMIISYVAKGYTTKEIAALMGKNETTIEAYRLRLLRMTGTNNSSHLIDWAYQNKVLCVK